MKLRFVSSPTIWVEPGVINETLKRVKNGQHFRQRTLINLSVTKEPSSGHVGDCLPCPESRCLTKNHPQLAVKKKFVTRSQSRRRCVQARERRAVHALEPTQGRQGCLLCAAWNTLSCRTSWLSGSALLLPVETCPSFYSDSCEVAATHLLVLNL